MAAEPIGCVTGCGRPAFTRGLCLDCLYRQKRRIAAGEITDAELVSQGLRLPVRRKGRRRPKGAE